MSAVFTRIPLLAPVEVARNAIPNPSFETDISSWFVGATNPVLGRTARVPVSVVGGNWNLRVTSAAAGSQDFGIGSGGLMPAAPGQLWSSAILSTANRPTRNIQGFISFYTAGGAIIGAPVSGAVIPAVLGARPVVNGAVAPVGTASVRAYWSWTGVTAAAETSFWDEAILSPTAVVPDFFDGNGAAQYAPYKKSMWLGVQNLSVSVQQIAGVGDAITALGVDAPMTYSRQAENIVHTLLDDPSVTWQTLRKAQRIKGTMLAYFDSAAAARAAVDAFPGPNGWSFDGSSVSGLAVPQFVVPAGADVAMEQADPASQWNTTRSEFLYAVTIPFQGVTT